MALKVKELQLRNVFVSALIFDVLFNDMLVAFAADCCYVVTVCPEFTTPEFFFYRGKEFKDGARGGALDQSDYLPSRVFWQETTEQMDVVLVKSDGLYVNGEALRKSVHRHRHDFLDRIIKQSFPVLYGNLDMIEAF